MIEGNNKDNLKNEKNFWINSFSQSNFKMYFIEFHKNFKEEYQEGI